MEDLEVGVVWVHPVVDRVQVWMLLDCQPLIDMLLLLLLLLWCG